MVPGIKNVIDLSRYVDDKLFRELERGTAAALENETFRKFASHPVSQGANILPAVLKLNEGDSLDLTNKAGHILKASINSEAVAARKGAKLPAEWNWLDKKLFQARLWIDERLHGFKPFMEKVFGAFQSFEHGVGEFIQGKHPFGDVNLKVDPEGKIEASISQFARKATGEDGEVKEVAAASHLDGIKLDLKDLPTNAQESVQKKMPKPPEPPKPEPAAPTSVGEADKPSPTGEMIPAGA